MNLVSVVVCCYNGIKYIDRCFSCILSQTYSDIEVLFVDDGSLDDSYLYAMTYRKAFEDRGFSFNCFTQENKGAGGAAALGLLHAKGDYISCYDIDDILYPESIQERVSFLENHIDYAGVRTNGYKISPDGKSKVLFVIDEVEKRETDIFNDLLLGKTNNWAGSYMVRSSVLWEIFPDHHIIESRFGQNLQILMTVAYQNKIGFVDIPLMEYVYNPDSFTNNGRNLDFELKNLEGYKQIRKRILDHLGIHDVRIHNMLNAYYLYLYMDLALKYKDIILFKNSYEQLKIIEKPSNIYSYYYYYYVHNSFIVSFYYRIKYKIMKK